MQVKKLQIAEFLRGTRVDFIYSKEHPVKLIVYIPAQVSKSNRQFFVSTHVNHNDR